jgi:predicted amino acid racemase
VSALQEETGNNTQQTLYQSLTQGKMYVRQTTRACENCNVAEVKIKASHGVKISYYIHLKGKYMSHILTNINCEMVFSVCGSEME